MRDTRSDAKAYLDFALDLMQQHALTRAGLDWPSIRSGAMSRCSRGSDPEGAYDAIRWALAALGDGHSFFSAPTTATKAIAEGTYKDEVSAPSSRLLLSGVRVIEVPAFRGTARDALNYSGALHSLLSEGAESMSRGWIIDVSSNTGGNMLPMLAGLAPLLGDGELGAFRFPDGTRIPWTYRGGELRVGADSVCCVPDAVASEELSRAQVAIVQGSRTASSGEAVVLAFRGRPRTKSFGRATAGLTTCNDQFELPDGASIAITVARLEDRFGGVPRGPLQPDTVIPGPGPATHGAALAWLMRELTDE